MVYERPEIESGVTRLNKAFFDNAFDGIDASLTPEEGSALYAPSEAVIVATQDRFPGLDTTGATSAVAGLNAILAAAPAGATVRLKGTYLFDGMVNWSPARFLTVDASAATIIVSGAGVKVRCLGSFGAGFAVTGITTEVLTVENKTRTFTKLSVTGTPPYVQGDVVKIIANDVIPGGHVTSSTTAPRVGEFAIVHSVAPGVMYLKNALLETYTLNPRVARLNQGSARWIGGIVKATDAAIAEKQGITFLRFQNLVNPQVSDLDVRSQTGITLSFKSCFGYEVDNVVQTYAMDNTDTANLGYAVHDSSCNDGRIDGCSFTGGRHGYTDGTNDSAVDGSDFSDFGATINTKVARSTARGMTAACWDTHHDSMGVEFIDCTAYPLTEEAAFLLRGRNHRVINPKVYYGNSVVRITTQLTDTWSQGESYGHEVINPWSRGTKIGIDVAVREDAVHPSAGVRQEAVNVDLHGGVFVDGQYIIYGRNARVRLHGGQRLQLPATVAAGTSGVEIRNTELFFDDIEIDGTRVATAGGSNRGVFANDTVAGKGSDIRGRKYRIDGSTAYIAAVAILVCLTDTARCDIDDLAIEKYWSTSTPLTVPPGVAAAIRWHYPSENPSAGSSQFSRSSKITPYSNSALATNTWQNLRLAGDESLLLDATIDDSTARTLAQLWIGRRRGQRLTIYMTAANAALTIQHGTTGRTLLAGAANKVLSAAGDSLSLMWTGSTWSQV